MHTNCPRSIDERPRRHWISSHTVRQLARREVTGYKRRPDGETRHPTPPMEVRRRCGPARWRRKQSNQRDPALRLAQQSTWPEQWHGSRPQRMIRMPIYVTKDCASLGTRRHKRYNQRNVYASTGPNQARKASIIVTPAPERTAPARPSRSPAMTATFSYRITPARRAPRPATRVPTLRRPERFRVCSPHRRAHVARHARSAQSRQPTVEDDT